MPRKQKQVPKKKNKSMGLHILGVSLFTLFWVGGNVFLLLSPLYAASFSRKQGMSNGDLMNSQRLVMPDQKGNEQNIVYLVKLRGQHSLYQAGRFSLNGKDVSDPSATYLNDYAISDMKNLDKKAILSLPEGSKVERSINSADGKLLIFTISTPVRFIFLNDNKDIFGQNNIVNTVFSYDVEKSRLTQLFTSSDYASINYALPTSISDDNNHVAFDSFECLECGPTNSNVFVYEISSNTLKSVGKVADFRWVAGKDYEYKELISEKCSTDKSTTGICYKDPTLQPFKKGSWK
jgi:hypothetical protein